MGFQRTGTRRGRVLTVRIATDGKQPVVACPFGWGVLLVGAEVFTAHKKDRVVLLRVAVFFQTWYIDTKIKSIVFVLPTPSPFKETPMLFPLSGITVDPWLPPLVAFVISFFTSMGGISGAFLLLPFQLSVLGYTHPSVSSTNQLYNIVAIPSGVYRYCKEGRMVWPLVWAVVIGTLPGVLIGAVVRVTGLRDPRHFKLFAAVVILYIALKMIKDLRRRPAEAAAASKGGPLAATYGNPGTTVTITHRNLKRIGYTFQGESYDVSVMGIGVLCFIVGIIGGIYGIGGGAIIAPFLVTFFGLPVYTVAGAALMGTFVTSVAGVVFYTAIAPLYPQLSVAPDWLLGILFGLGGMAGMYLGARCQKFVPARAIKGMLVVIMLGTALKYILEFLK